jgi:hypothetical protein
LGAGDRDQGLDVLGFQFGYRLAAGKTGIGEDRPRQADGLFHGQDGRRKLGWSLGVVAMLVARMSWLPSAQTTAWAL